MEYDIEKFEDKEIYSSPDEFNLPKKELWYKMAQAYISSSLHLLYAIANDDLTNDFFISKTCISLFHQAIENFFKFGLSAANEKIPTIHNLQNLY